MGLLDGLQPASMTSVCKVTLICNSLETNDAKILTEALDDLQKWSSHALANALSARGIARGMSLTATWLRV